MSQVALTLEMINEARKVMSNCTFKGKPVPLNWRYDLLPPPDHEGRHIIGPATGNEYEAIFVDGILKWRLI